MKSRVVKGVEHFSYDTIEEFRKTYPIEPLYNWRDAEKGDWVISEDLQVAQVLAEGWLGAKVRWVRTVIGMFNRRWHSMEGAYSPNIYHLNAGQKNRMSHDDKMFVKIFVENGGKMEKAWMQSRPYSVAKSPRIQAQRLLNFPIIQKAIMDEVRHKIKDFLDPETAAEIMTRAASKAADKGDLDKLLPFMAFWGNITEGLLEPKQLADGEIPAPIPQTPRISSGLAKLSQEESNDN